MIDTQRVAARVTALESGPRRERARRWPVPRHAAAALLAAFSTLAGGCGGPTTAPVAPTAPAEWLAYGGDSAGTRYSPLAQIDRTSVRRLAIAWTHHSGEFADGKGAANRTTFEATPLVADGRLFYCSPSNKVFALDPRNGKELWTFDPKLQADTNHGYASTCRGVSYWRDPAPTAGGACGQRILTGTRGSELIALDAVTGRPCQDFGRDGRVDLRAGFTSARSWEMYPTSPPLIVNDLAVLGNFVIDNKLTIAPAGGVRAYDVKTGILRWSWDALPENFDPTTLRGYEPGKYPPGTPNAWAPLSADASLGLVYVPTGNGSGDFYGATRNGVDRYGSSVVALNARDGRVAWSFQTVHHDLWDYDVSSQPTLVDLPKPDGSRVPALIQPTKTGQLFVLDRRTGVPIFPVKERPVPRTDVPGETTSPTQPFVEQPEPLHPLQAVKSEDAWGLTPWDRGDCRAKIAALRSEGPFTPPSLRGSIIFPGIAGGMNWGSAAIDPRSGRAFMAVQRTAFVVRLFPRANEETEKATIGKAFMAGLEPMPALPYGAIRQPLMSSWGMPCTPPPWATLASVDLTTGHVVWQSTLGTLRDVAPWPLWLHSGSGYSGGPLVTAAGLVFIGGTMDHFIRAFDASTGEEVWRHRLPLAATATPMTYALADDKRQFVVIAAGGTLMEAPGDSLIAFALPQ